MSKKSSRSRRSSRRSYTPAANHRLPSRFSPSSRTMTPYSSSWLTPSSFLSPSRPVRKRLNLAKVIENVPSARPLKRARPFLSPAPYFKNEVLKKVLPCVRRQMRKEVLHALKKTGSVGQRSPRFTRDSAIKCN